MLLFTLFSHSEEQRAGGCQQILEAKPLPYMQGAANECRQKHAVHHFVRYCISLLVEMQSRSLTEKAKKGKRSFIAQQCQPSRGARLNEIFLSQVNEPFQVSGLTNP